MRTVKISLLLIAAGLSVLSSQAAWKPVPGQIMTRWAAEVDPKCPLPEYPRPQMVRVEWQNLNGLWDYAVTPIEAASSAIGDGQILVPFAIESALSGVKRTFTDKEKLWYKRTFDVPASWRTAGRRVILHFGAVDYECTVKVNGRKAGSHAGSSDAFNFDITDLLVPGDKQEVSLEVTDPTDNGRQPRGKQVFKPGGIRYTAVSGIWKTVWMEPVAKQHITSFKGVPDIDKGTYTVAADVALPEGARVAYTVLDGGKEVAKGSGVSGEKVVLGIPSAKWWSNETPFLYDLKMTVTDKAGKTVDEVKSYFGMRKISIAKDEKGFNRIMLNNKFVFQYGFLDQGWWPESLLTAPTEEALVFDVDFTKRAGFNTIRKHIKIESDRFYYHCDKTGVIVWQDAVSGDKFNAKDFYNRPVEKDPVAAKQFETELKAMIDQLYNYPCIVNWVVFNEGWGQYGGTTWIDWTKRYDPSRLAEVSGWVDMGNGDINDVHHYPDPARVDNPGPNRAFAVGEFGGLGLPVKGHLWNPDMRNWGYSTFDSKDKLEEKYKYLIFHLRTMIPEGLSAAIYTQTTDVEGEVNGMLTYDRAVEKIPAAELAAIHAPLYGKQMTLKVAMDDSQKSGKEWYYTTVQPETDWYGTSAPKGWKQGKAPFGFMPPSMMTHLSYYERTDPATVPATEWKSPDIWIWREFDLSEIPSNPYLRMRYEVNFEVYINGVPAYELAGRGAHYYNTAWFKISDKAIKSLKKGKNTIAIHSNRPPKKEASYIIDAQIVDLGD